MKVYQDKFVVHRVLKKDLQTRIDLIPGSKDKMIFDVYIMGLPTDVEKFKKLIEKVLQIQPERLLCRGHIGNKDFRNTVTFGNGGSNTIYQK